VGAVQTSHCRRASNRARRLGFDLMDEFDRVSSWLQAAIDEGGNTHSLDDIRQAIAEDRMVLRTTPHAAFLLDIVHYPKFKALRVIGAGGESHAALEELKDMAINVVPALAKAAGVHRYQWQGRPGWARILKQLGMTCQVSMYKEI
jgi:hypothetical protein